MPPRRMGKKFKKLTYQKNQIELTFDLRLVEEKGRYSDLTDSFHFLLEFKEPFEFSEAGTDPDAIWKKAKAALDAHFECTFDQMLLVTAWASKPRKQDANLCPGEKHYWQTDVKFQLRIKKKYLATRGDGERFVTDRAHLDAHSPPYDPSKFGVWSNGGFSTPGTPDEPEYCTLIPDTPENRAAIAVLHDQLTDGFARMVQFLGGKALTGVLARVESGGTFLSLPEANE